MLTAEQSLAQQRAAATHLRHAGLRAGDRVALTASSTPELVSVVLGALRTGVVPIPLDPRLTARERDNAIEDTQPAAVYDDLSGLVDDTHADAPELAPVPLARPMHLTSGTTGRPKGVWSGLLSPQAAAALVDEERNLWGFTPSDRHCVLSPLHHSAPLRFAMGTLLAGGSIIVPGPFDPARVLDAVTAYRPTTTFCVPAHLQRLFDHLGATATTPDLTSFRLVAHAGAPCPLEVKRRALAAFPEGTVWEFYGSTEGQFTVCSPAEWLERPGTVGRARPGRQILVDDDGVVWCVVPEHARFSYVGDADKTAAAWSDTEHGPAFTVGDLGRIDERGYLFLEGRRDDLVISGGVNVSPVEVEEVLRRHPRVQDVAVFGVPDERWGQRVCAAVVGSADPATLDALARTELAPPKRPKEYVRVTDLPRTTSGKVRRTALIPLVRQT